MNTPTDEEKAFLFPAEYWTSQGGEAPANAQPIRGIRLPPSSSSTAIDTAFLLRLSLEAADTPSIVRQMVDIRVAIDAGLPLSQEAVGVISKLGFKRLEGACLEGLDLKSLALSNAELTKTNFRRADLRGVDFQGATNVGADFSGADLGGADFNFSNNAGAQFDGANVFGATFCGASGQDLSTDCNCILCSEASGSLIRTFGLS